MAAFPEPKITRVRFDPTPVRLKCKSEDGSVLTQGQFATLVGLSENGLSHMVNSPSRVSLSTIDKIMSVTGCSLSDLFRVESG